MEGKNLTVVKTLKNSSPLIRAYFRGRGGGAYLWGGREKTMIPVLHTELENKVEKLKYKKLEVMQPRNFQLVNRPSGSVHTKCYTKFYSCDWLIQSIIYK